MGHTDTLRPLAHEVNLTRHRRHDEHLASCTCGWVGTHFPDRAQALRDALAHSDAAINGRTEDTPAYHRPTT